MEGGRVTDIGRAPGRPAGLRGAELLAVARDVFLENGFAGATMQDVAARAGVSKTSLYREHPGKDDLFAAVVLDWAARGRGAMRPALDALLEAASLRAGLLELVRTVQAAVLDEAPLRMRRLVASEAERFPSVSARYVAAIWNANIADLAGALTTLRDRGSIRSGTDPQIAAEQLTWMAVGAPLNAQTLGAPALSDERLMLVAKAAVDAFLQAYGRRVHG
jgi:AcrR family transcriptional regulator